MLVNNYNSILKRKSGGLQPETRQQIGRILSDGGTVIDIPWMDSVIRTLKILGIYSNCKLLTDANFGVKKDITGAVSKLYDISGNNNDAVQATGASQPIWSLVNGRGVITYDGSNDFLNAGNSPYFNTIGSFTVMTNIILSGYNNNGSSWNCFLGKGQLSTATGWAFAINSSNIKVFSYNANETNSFIIALNTICQVVGVRDDSLGETISYINGVLKKAVTISPITTSTNSLFLGKDSLNTRYMRGQINTTSFFDIALTQDQISALYNLGL